MSRSVRWIWSSASGRAGSSTSSTPAWSGRLVLGGPCVDHVEHRAGWFWGDEAQHLLQQGVDHWVHAAVLEGLPVVLGLPYLYVAQPLLGAVGQVRDQAGRAHRADAVLDARVDVRGDRHLVGECVRHETPILIRSTFGLISSSWTRVRRRSRGATTRAAGARQPRAPAGRSWTRRWTCSPAGATPPRR